jgi:NAD(P)H-dependent FMN reductase/DNA-binding CsgD family transcriptional regulator
MRLIALAGTTRPVLCNHQLIDAASEGARRAGAEVTRIDLRDFPLPLWEHGVEVQAPEAVLRLQRLCEEHHGFLIASPAENGSVTTLLKNVLAWVALGGSSSRPLRLRGKIAGLMSASGSTHDATMAVDHLRVIATTLGVRVLPTQVIASAADLAVGARGRKSALGAAERLGAIAALGGPTPPVEPSELTPRRFPFPPDLTERERQVLRLRVEGLSCKQISAKLGISANTVRTHLKHLHEKFEVSTAVELASAARKITYLCDAPTTVTT